MDPSNGEHTAAAQLGDLPLGQPVGVVVDGIEVVLVRIDDTCYSTQGECSHAAGPLRAGRLVDRYLLECPLHGAVFDIRTGEVLRGPARRPLRCYETTIEGDTVMLRVPDRDEPAPGTSRP
ncbi:MAG: Rieske (2Fe-2S) protein [Actinomycetota bacterium]